MEQVTIPNQGMDWGRIFGEISTSLQSANTMRERREQIDVENAQRQLNMQISQQQLEQRSQELAATQQARNNFYERQSNIQGIQDEYNRGLMPVAESAPAGVIPSLRQRTPEEISATTERYRQRMYGALPAGTTTIDGQTLTSADDWLYRTQGRNTRAQRGMPYEVFVRDFLNNPQMAPYVKDYSFETDNNGQMWAVPKVMGQTTQAAALAGTAGVDARTEATRQHTTIEQKRFDEYMRRNQTQEAQSANKELTELMAGRSASLSLPAQIVLMHDNPALADENGNFSYTNLGRFYSTNLGLLNITSDGSRRAVANYIVREKPNDPSAVAFANHLLQPNFVMADGDPENFGKYYRDMQQNDSLISPLRKAYGAAFDMIARYKGAVADDDPALSAIAENAGITLPEAQMINHSIRARETTAHDQELADTIEKERRALARQISNREDMQNFQREMAGSRNEQQLAMYNYRLAHPVVSMRTAGTTTKTGGAVTVRAFDVSDDNRTNAEQAVHMINNLSATQWEAMKEAYPTAQATWNAIRTKPVANWKPEQFFQLANVMDALNTASVNEGNAAGLETAGVRPTERDMVGALTPAAGNTITPQTTPSATATPPASRARQVTIRTPRGGVINFRSTPNGAVIGTIPSGYSGQVIDADGGWSKILYNGKPGYISTQFAISAGQ